MRYVSLLMACVFLIWAILIWTALVPPPGVVVAGLWALTIAIENLTDARDY